MYMIITDLKHISFLKPGYARQFKHEKKNTIVNCSRHQCAKG